VGVFIFGSVQFLSKKYNQIEFFFKKNQNRFKPTGFGSVRFGFLEQKPVQTGLAQFWLGFFRFGSVFSGFFGSVPDLKNRTEPNRSVFSKF
jgi:hypothetical protein